MKRYTLAFVAASAAALISAPVSAQHGTQGHVPPSHKLVSLANGGRIELQAGKNDTASTRMVREHLREFSLLLAAGKLTAEQLRCAPGLDAVAALRSSITYSYGELPTGAELTFASTNSKAVDAIHKFIDGHGAPSHGASTMHGSAATMHASGDASAAMQACMASHHPSHGSN
ncbi:MAG: hypothetical protein ABIV28_08645 [Longimicrobiales bacterium]